MRLLVWLSIMMSAALFTGAFAGAPDIAGLPFANFAAIAVTLAMSYVAVRA
jgi:hypothetical protein